VAGKGNPYHDPKSGEFTHGPNGAKSEGNEHHDDKGIRSAVESGGASDLSPGTVVMWKGEERTVGHVFGKSVVLSKDDTGGVLRPPVHIDMSYGIKTLPIVRRR